MNFGTYLKAFDYRERSEMRIDIKSMLALYKEEKIELVDIRFPEEIKTWGILFAKHIPLNELPDRMHELDEKKIIVTMCPQVDRSSLARHFLTLNGFKSKYLVGGMQGLVDYLRGDRAKNFAENLR